MKEHGCNCSFTKKFNRALSYKDYIQSINSADFIAYLDDKKWLLAMDDLLFFCEKRIKDSDYYEG
ncbi:hypothetical protein C3I17_03330 [Campylobacter jejuni]|uniref:hypothetical protein n=1 Tax=Campylobacter jejuni TaxID=197 RepID=UPI000F804B16|nr:hypothetical protein [Campylobacter jejuni]RTI61395.1 hypothetical protein C3I17_03330 [Campylobacter jejuni]RTI69740.1 hypothetical protein C3I16_08625 [Campylobacter jejuni]RTI99613.1 hypothetical protein C3H95_04835 [Campylobacter jejuni]RTJ20003.1 hypothetical protein C3H83_04835 [Campylobacter jejuni]HED5351662.1 hypothetical protein [Campylobacter jejuni]